MKKIVYLFLIGIMIIIPKIVFAYVIDVSYGTSGAYYDSQVKYWNDTFKYTQDGITYYDFILPNDYINRFTVQLQTSSFASLDTSSNYNISGSFTMATYLEPGMSPDFASSSLVRMVYSSYENSTWFVSNCETTVKRSDYDIASFDFKCSSVNLAASEIYLDFKTTNIKLSSLNMSNSLDVIQIGSNAEIVDGIHDLNETQKETNEKLDGINDSLNDSNVDMDGANSFFGDFSDTDHGGISGVITAPLRFINKMTGTCSPMSFDVLGADVELPCGDTLFWNKPEVASFRIFWNVLFGGAFLYLMVTKLFKVIDNLKNPDDSRIEVMKL